MVEMMFGAGSPMWTAMPPMGLLYQPMGLGTRPVATSAFDSPLIGGGIGGSTAQGLPPPGQSHVTYGYGGGVTPHAQQNLAAPGLGVPYLFASTPLAGAIADPTGVVTASSMLTAVAMLRGQPQGPTNDPEVEEFIYDALELLPGAADVDVRCEGGRVTLTGSVQHKRTKRDVGEIAWAIPALHDVQNNVTIASRRRVRPAGRESEAPASGPAASVSARKQA